MLILQVIVGIIVWVVIPVSLVEWEWRRMLRKLGVPRTRRKFVKSKRNHFHPEWRNR